ncbi:hypothetical protein [Thalassobellus suaedae]|uniref:Uncharacterized protein n=1 Tax=Thalassobellus suaedae TaxID=3074124 RepID=A0ABY9XQE1_9FLAO|nr:hypothetical protein RHP51_13325 [Flavobacteriaceae bacterium HL-DH14]
MHKILFKLSLLMVVCCLTTSMYGQKAAKNKADRDTDNWRYEIQCVNVSSDGSYVIKIFSYSKNKNVAIEQSKKNAVHGVIFRGIPQSDVGCVKQPPLARHPNLEEKNRDFFKSFFSENGDYQKFITLTTDGAVAAGDRFKIGKNEYKIGVIVSVNIAGLRKHLESAGIIKGLSSGF